MSYTKESIEYRGHIIEIVSDDDPQNPRTDWGPAGVMCAWHSRYNLGDMDGNRPISDNYNEPIDLLYELAGIDREEYQEKQYEESGEYSDMQYAELYQKIEEKGTVILPISLYDHSGISMNVGGPTCRWDGSRVGWIFITKDKIEAEGWTKEQATKYLEGEVETYSQYLEGDVWGWRVEDEDGDIVESCYGYYGDNGVEDAIAEGKATIDRLCKKAQEEYEKLPKKKAAECYMI